MIYPTPTRNIKERKYPYGCNLPSEWAIQFNFECRFYIDSIRNGLCYVTQQVNRLKTNAGINATMKINYISSRTSPDLTHVQIENLCLLTIQKLLSNFFLKCLLQTLQPFLLTEKAYATAKIILWFNMNNHILK